MQIGAANRHRWGVILAGGEGARLRSLTRFVSGEDTPKQFCPLLGGRTLLSQTRRRIAKSIPQERTIFVLLNSHERFFNKELASVSPTSLIVQPSNRGTLPAILCSLIGIARQDPEAMVAFFPSDHYYSEEETFMAGVELAFDAAEANPETVILLGVAAKHAEVEYGWIEAAPALSSQSRHGLLKVKRFWEKPSAQTAQDLLARGCVWNTFVMVGRAQAFLDLVRSGTPESYRQFEPLISSPDTPLTVGVLSSVYDRLQSADFSKLVLSSAPEALGVWCLGDVGWSDLGDPRRVISTLSETGVHHEWMASWREVSAAVAAGS
jgi:mannose-1-phosphate guanylyltransferase